MTETCTFKAAATWYFSAPVVVANVEVVVVLLLRVAAPSVVCGPCENWRQPRTFQCRLSI